MTTTPPPFTFHRGTQPLLISMPHAGTYVPPQLAARFTDEARQVPDTDWHMERLYAFAKDMGASILVATHSRYVVDLNRPPDGASLYPGQSVTGLCPVDTFDDTPIYAQGGVPDDAEIAARREAVWAPYHAQLRAELDRIRAQHGVAMLWDAHSIRSVLPRFFEGKLPDLNLGTADGASCDPALAQELLAIARSGPREAEFWERAIGRREQTEADFRRARELIVGTGAIEATLDLAHDYAGAAKAALSVFPGGAWRSALESLADFAVSRSL